MCNTTDLKAEEASTWVPTEHQQYRHQLEQYSVCQCYADWIKKLSSTYPNTVVPATPEKTVTAWFVPGRKELEARWTDHTDRSEGGFCSVYGNPEDVYGFWVDTIASKRGRWDRRFGISVVEDLQSKDPRDSFIAAQDWAQTARITALREEEDKETESALSALTAD